MNKILALALLLGACGSPPDEAAVTSDLINGVVDPGHPNVLRLVFVRIAGDAYACTTTLVGSRTLLTAAHCWPGDITKAWVQVPGRADMAVVGGTIDPQFVGGTTAEYAAHDVAILHLAADVDGIEPAVLWSGPPKIGETTTMVGFVMFDADDDIDGQKRDGTNQVKAVDAGYFESDHTNTTHATLGHGDSGGPAFVLRGGRSVVMGVASKGTGVSSTFFGLVDTTKCYHARVDASLAWIRTEAAGDLYDGSTWTRPATSAPVASVSALSVTRSALSASAPSYLYLAAQGEGAVELTLWIDGSPYATLHAELPVTTTTTVSKAPGQHYVVAEVQDSATGAVLREDTFRVTVGP